MQRRELVEIKRKYLSTYHPYKLTYWEDYKFSVLSNILWIKRSGKGDNDSYADCIIMADTETSKKTAGINENHVVAFTISIRAYDMNIVTLWGRKPDDMIHVMAKIHKSIGAEHTIFYFHNYSYDYVFLRKFMFKEWGLPTRVLNTNPHYPILMCFENGIIIKDSLILAQRSLDKWSEDMNVEHQKSVGKWDYDKYRNQNETFSDDELEYIEHDTLAGVECLQALKDNLNKHIYAMPYTATGIPREEIKRLGEANRGHNWFLSNALTYEQQCKMEMVYHGGYTHGNRMLINQKLTRSIICYDFASSYPYCMLSEKFPAEKFAPYQVCNIKEILDMSDEYAFTFKLIMINPHLKRGIVMPALQCSKCVQMVNPITDNGRILQADYIEIYLTELDLQVISKQYVYDMAICKDVEFAVKEYLPRWITDYVFQLFEAKTVLKGGDPVLYAISKATLNSCYGMTVQKPVKENIVEDYDSGEYSIEHEGFDPEEEYDKYIERFSTMLPYQIGVWVTAAAFRNLFELGSCAGTWIYSDTDSCYGMNWDIEKLDAYNNKCKEKLQANGYGPALKDGIEYWLGVAEFDKEYSEFKVQGAKRYCGRAVKDGKLHITVAGVPKKGALALNDDIESFVPGLIFPGIVTGKKTHTYFYVKDIYTDKNGNITGDSINLSPCDYLLDSVNVEDFDAIWNEDIAIQTYEEDADEKI